MKRFIALACASMLLTACAAFQANPTAAQCADAQDKLGKAEQALVVAQQALAIAEAAATDSKYVDAAKAALAAANAEVSVLQDQIDRNCATH